MDSYLKCNHRQKHTGNISLKLITALKIKQVNHKKDRKAKKIQRRLSENFYQNKSTDVKKNFP